jgi:hypothetical protein
MPVTQRGDSAAPDHSSLGRGAGLRLDRVSAVIPAACTRSVAGCRGHPQAESPATSAVGAVSPGMLAFPLPARSAMGYTMDFVGHVLIAPPLNDRRPTT